MIGVNILITLFNTIRQSRCTDIRSSCCGFDLEIERDVITTDDAVIAKPVEK